MFNIKISFKNFKQQASNITFCKAWNYIMEQK